MGNCSAIGTKLFLNVDWMTFLVTAFVINKIPATSFYAVKIMFKL